MADEPIEFPPDLTPDGIAKRLAAGPGLPRGYASFKGYLAPERDGVFRFFKDDAFMSWIEVEDKDIVARINVPANETDPRSLLYVKRNARIVACQLHKAHELGQAGADPGAYPGEYGHPPWP